MQPAWQSHRSKNELPFLSMQNKNNKILVVVIRSIYDSLDTHLDFTVTKNDRKFEVKTIREYAEDIVKLSALLK